MKNKKFKIFLYRCLHFVLRHISAIDSKVEKRLVELTNEKHQCAECPLLAFPNKAPFFGDIKIITHAGGAMSGLTYLNCMQGLDFYYANGNRNFEFDVQKSIDDKYVLSHSDINDTLRDFLDEKIDYRFDPMSLYDVLDFMLEHDDVKVIFDCKFENLKLFAQCIKDYVQREQILSRIVIQIFKEQDIKAVREVYEFKLLYVCMMNTDYLQVAKECLTYGVGAISISEKAVQERKGWNVFIDKNICMFAYTVNSINSFDRLRAQGITGVFSDFLLEQDVAGDRL